MRKRAEQVAETRRRITEAAVRLHTTVGPANTTISAVAEEAGVTRVTVYRHFPEEEQLFLACSTHWAALHPSPDPATWREVEGLEERARVALGELYVFYQENHADLEPILRDMAHMPDAVQRMSLDRFAEMAAVLTEPSTARGARRRRIAAVAGHVVGFSTWRSLVLAQGLHNAEAVEVAVGFLTCAAGPPG